MLDLVPSQVTVYHGMQLFTLGKILTLCTYKLPLHNIYSDLFRECKVDTLPCEWNQWGTAASYGSEVGHAD